MMFLYLHAGFRHRVGSAACWPTEFDTLPHCGFLNLSLSVSVSLPHTLSSSLSLPPSLSRSPPSLFVWVSLSPLALPVSVSFSFQAWNHLIIAYSSFGMLLNAHLSKPGGNNLPRDITHTHRHTHTHTLALSFTHTSRSGFITAGPFAVHRNPSPIPD